MKKILFVLQTAFWCAVAYIPLAIDYEITDFMVTKNCMPGSDCLRMAMPLIVQIALVGWAARVLLWPLAAWHLGGGWLLRRYRASRLPQSGLDTNA